MLKRITAALMRTHNGRPSLIPTPTLIASSLSIWPQDAVDMENS